MSLRCQIDPSTYQVERVSILEEAAVFLSVKGADAQEDGGGVGPSDGDTKSGRAAEMQGRMLGAPPPQLGFPCRSVHVRASNIADIPSTR